MGNNTVYMQIKDQLNIEKNTVLKVQDLVTIVGEESTIQRILGIDVVDISNYTNDYLVISMIMIIEKIREDLPQIEFNVIGKDEMLLRIKKDKKSNNVIFEWTKVFLVCTLLFLGAALAITHFHADVNMAEAHSQIYKLITGKYVEKPILLQISYSLGLGIGMTVFFYHISPRKIRNQPNPLDIELYSYRKGMEDYILDQEKNKV